MNSEEYRKKCEWLADFYAEAAKTGRQMQCLIAGPTWTDAGYGPTLKSDPQDWRLKPEPQKAWLVWANDWACVLLTEQAAKNQARMIGGIIQEITRPESQ